MNNIIQCAIGAHKRGVTVTRPAWLYDYGMKLKIVGLELPTAYEVDFAHSKTETATRMVGDADGVDIPNALFESGTQILAWLYVHEDLNDGYTVYEIKIPLLQRPHVDGAEPTPAQQDAIDVAIAALNDAIERTSADVVESDANAERAENAAEAAEASSTAASSSEINARGYANQAAQSEQSAQSSASTATAQAQAAASSAISAANAASSAANSAEAAETARQQAESEKEAAQAARTGAEHAETNAGSSALSASNSASEAATSAANASHDADRAEQSEANAAASATAAVNAKNDAVSAKNIAVSSKNDAVDAKTAAQTAQAAAESWATGGSSGTPDASNNAKYYSEQAAASATEAATASTNFAPTYGSSATYAVGDYVLYNSVLYRCNTPISTAEAWTAAHWTAVKLGPDVADLKSALSWQTVFASEVMEAGQVVYNPTYTNNTMNQTTGKQSIAASNRASTPGYYYVPVGCVISIEMDTSTVSMNVYCYAEDKTYLGRKTNNDVSDKVVALAPGTRYVRFFVIYKDNADITPAQAASAVTFTCLYTGRIQNLEGLLQNGAVGDIHTGYANINTGSVSTNSAYRYHEIAVYPGEKILYKTGTAESIAGIVFYNERGKYLSGTAATKSVQTITAPAKAAYAIVAFRATQASDLYIWVTMPTQYVANGVLANAAYRPEFVLPAESVAVVGHEWNCYFDNVIRGMDFEKYAVYVRSVSGTVSSKKCFERMLRILPAAGDVGDHSINLQIIDKKYCTVVDNATFTLHIIADTTLTGKKVMFIGDSLTNAGIYPAEIQYNLSNGGIVSVGTRQSTVTIDGNTYTVNHEGRSGWASYDYTRSVSGYRTDVPNPFWDGTKFNFSYYMANSGVDVPDVACIGLGTNGGVAGVADVLTMVESIHEYNPNIPVLVSLITPPAGQNGCGYLTRIQSAALLKSDFLDVNAAYISAYENGIHTGVVDLYFQLDREHDFPTVTVAVSARNPETETIQANNVHPSIYGYLHFADAYYNRLLYQLTT